MTASCGNSEDNGDGTPTASQDDGYDPGAFTLAEGPTFVGEEPGDTLSTVMPGDFNGDGEMDLALGAAFADGADGPDAGKVYVFYSVANLPSGEVPVGEADAIFTGSAGDQTGRALAAADINGDRVDDLIIGAPAASDGERAQAGKVYVLVGNPVFDQVRAAELSGNEPAITGGDEGDYLGYTLTTGDFNNDGTSDLAIGAFLADGPDNEREDAGEVHILYGGDPPRDVDLAASSLDAVVYGAEPGDRLSEGLASGDFNGDRRDDLIVAATFGDSDEAEDAGTTYVLTAEMLNVLDLADTVRGAVISGIDAGDQLGHSLAAGDLNGDGFDDILLGAVSGDGPDNAADLAGEVAIVFGTAEPQSRIEARTDAAIIYGVAAGRLGRAVAAGDLSGDGLADAVLCASEAPDGDGNPEAGALYVLPGKPEGTIPGSAAEAATAYYGLPHENLCTQVNGIPATAVRDLNRDDMADIAVAAPRANEDRGRVIVLMAQVAR